MLHKDFLDRVNVGFAWGLIESFATQPREQPDDANRGAELIAERLKSAGIPVTMHRPTLFLIDHRGVVRHAYSGWPAEKDLARDLEALLRRAEADRK